MGPRNRLGGVILGGVLALTALIMGEFEMAAVLVASTLWYMTSDSRWP